MTEFFLMGGYAFYVWASYALAAVVLIIHIVLNRVNHRKVLREVLDTQHVQQQGNHE